jgi:ABC-2 type transport system permease protein
MKLIRWTLDQRKSAIIWWSLGIMIFIFVNLIFYPTFKDQQAQLDQSLNQIPDTAKQLFSDTPDLFSPVGYLSSQVFYLMMPLILGVLSISLGVSLLGKEERETTLELLLARPVSRLNLLLSKASAGLIILAIVAFAGTIFTAIMCKIVGLAVAVPSIMAAGLAAGLLATTFGAIAYLVASLGRAGRAASIGVAAVIALGGYIIVSLAGTVEWLRWPAKIFPFNYYHASELLSGRYNWANAIYFIAVTTVCMILAWLAFRRRDLLGS